MHASRALSGPPDRHDGFLKPTVGLDGVPQVRSAGMSLHRPWQCSSVPVRTGSAVVKLADEAAATPVEARRL